MSWLLDADVLSQPVMTHGNREVIEWLERSVEALEGRILSSNVATAHVRADQKFLLEQAGQPMPVEDSYIAATARRHSLD